MDFYIDNVMQPSVWRPSVSRMITNVSFPITKGSHHFRWVYHQAPNSAGHARIQNVILMGVNGGSTSAKCPPGTYSSSGNTIQCSPCNPGSYTSEEGQSSCKLCAIGQFSYEYGSTGCLACGAGTYNEQTGMSHCLTDCTFSDGDGVFKLSWNISALGSAVEGPVTDYGVDNKVYFVNPCKPISDKSKCKDAQSNALSTYVCEVNVSSNSALSGGQNLEFSSLMDTATKLVNLVVTYRDGDSTGCAQGQRRSTRIIFLCDASGRNQIAFAGGDKCSKTFTWRTLYGCRMCDTSSSSSDYSRIVSDCSLSGLQTVTLVRNSSCNGPYILSTQYNNCELPVKHTIPVLAIVVAVAAALVLIAVIVGVLIRNRKLKHQYTSLLSQSINLAEDSEMSTLEMKDDKESPNEKKENI